MIFFDQNSRYMFTRKFLFLVKIICTSFFIQQSILYAQSTNNSTSYTISEKQQEYYSLIWHDEFNYDGGIDTNKWFHQTQIPNGISWFNNEIQHYTNRTKNSYVSNGTLKIIAQKENYTDQGILKNFTSARINSKFSFKYGRVEVKAKLPSGIGIWPAIWMLGKNIDEKGAYWQTKGFGKEPWPQCGEIDIMEHWGANQDYIQSALHTPSSSGNTKNIGGRLVKNTNKNFNIYCLEWSPQKMVFSVNDTIHYEYNPSIKNSENWPFNSDQYLILNIAVEPDISSDFVMDQLEIDYIRIYQAK